MKIAIIGVGHMGRWLAQMLAGRHTLCAFDLDPSRYERIHDVHFLPEPGAIEGFDPDLLINAVSLQNTIPAFESVSPFLSEACILSDLASVKGQIPEYYREGGYRFASVHPMFGPTFANVERIEDENAIIISESDNEGASFYRSLFEELDLKIFTYSFEEHDQMIAYSLTLPFASTMVFAACMENTAVPGTTFRKHMEIAKGLLSEDDFLLSEILFNSYSLPQLEKVTSRLGFLKHVIKGRDAEEAKRFFEGLRDNIR